MRIFKLLILLFVSVNLFAQSTDKTVIYGIVTSEVYFEAFSYSGIMYKEYTLNDKWFLSSISVDKNGKFCKSFPKDTKLELRTYYDNFFESDTNIFTGTLDSIMIKFVIHPKEYIYTEKSAQKDISNGLVQLITFDSLIYNWNQKIGFTKQFGFYYLLLPEPDDNDFKKNMDSYNYHVEEYLTATHDSLWNSKLFKIIDSLLNLDADNYGKEHIINYNNLNFPSSAVFPNSMAKAIQEKKSEFDRIFKKNKSQYLNYTSEFILDKIDSDSDYNYLFIAEYWIAFNYEKMIPELIKRISNINEVGLTNTADLIIWERIESKDLPFYGSGGIANDDLFKVAGRANHLLRQITGENFGSVSMYSTEKDLKKLQDRWAYWLINL